MWKAINTLLDSITNPNLICFVNTVNTESKDSLLSRLIQLFVKDLGLSAIHFGLRRYKIVDTKH